PPNCLPPQLNIQNLLTNRWCLTKQIPTLAKSTFQATWMAYDMVVMRTNPALADSMRRLEDAFLNCKEEMEKNWQELLNETKPKQ
uniref:Synaptonemal complex central element protein 3 n=1 Tax=Monodelphis domestica TaxID=13616 RepID=A0A5F8G5S8_MONDO